MTSQNDITDGLQFSIIANKNPINTTGSPRETITFQYAGTSEPGDLPFDGYYGWTNFTEAEKAVFEAQLDHIETFLNVDFVEVTGFADPDLNVGKVALPGTTIGEGGVSIMYDGATITELDSMVVFERTLDLSQEKNLLLHELGHALGLKHPFSSPAILSGIETTNKYTVMSYDVNPDNGLDSDAMMLYDILALQDIWGAADYNTGNDTYTGKRTDTIDVIWDTDGTDWFDADGRSTDVVLDLREGHFSSFDDHDDVAIAFNVMIENARGGSGDDTIAGNSGKNTLLGLKGDDEILGGAGKDKIKGGAGADTLIGQEGRDVLFGGNGADTFVFRDGDGKDKIRDFQDGTDTLFFEGFGSEATILAAAEEVNGHVIFDFGDDSRLTVQNTTLDAVSDDILV